MATIKRALVSVSDKTNLIELAKALAGLGVETLSTGGTAKTLREAGAVVKEVSDYTGFPECLDGRVKTLHPKVHGGLLGRRDLKSHTDTMAELGIGNIDLVVVNLYPFEATIAKQGVAVEEAVENIDIGGPAMIRSAAKNHRDVAVVVDPADYPAIIEELSANGGALSDETRRKLAVKAYAHTAWYDARIADWLGKRFGVAEKLPDRKIVALEKVQGMRYGENPHQQAAFYRQVGSGAGIPDAIQHHGKELSYNNIVDMAAAYELVCEFDEPACAIIKHTNPSGCARSERLVDAYVTARECDPVSAFGGVVAFNREVDPATATEVAQLFVEIVIAPGYTAEAMETLKAKKNVRIMELPKLLPNDAEPMFKSVRSGALLQDEDWLTADEDKIKVVGKRAPTTEEMKALRFAWTVAKHVKSNAIVYADADSTIGVGAGQMSRVDSSKIAISKANRPVKGAVMASDAFFPFRDAIDAAAEAGITAIIQPGGSVRDDEVVGAADEAGIAMVFTGVRHFRH
jgi:phosphoribosylaminoimidazolecarboxamide formyltransferase/IMP cyclohydrolase